MKMLRWICDESRKDRTRNERIWENLGITSIDDKLRETRLRWFRHVQNMPTMASVRKSFSMQVDEVKDMDGRNNDRSKEAQPIRGFDPGQARMTKQNPCS